MMITAIATVILGGQTLSGDTKVLYTGMPTTASSASVRMVSHSATARLEKMSYAYETVSELKNESSRPVTLTITIPVRGKDPTWPMIREHRVSALLDGRNLALKRSASTSPPDSEARENGVPYGSYRASHRATVAFKPGQTRSLKTHYKSPLGRAGLDGLQRVVAYDTSGARSWNGEVRQFNHAIQYRPSLVFQVFAALPQSYDWKIGTDGAFVKNAPFRPTDSSITVFTYYPGGFDKIGG